MKPSELAHASGPGIKAAQQKNNSGAGTRDNIASAVQISAAAAQLLNQDVLPPIRTWRAAVAPRPGIAETRRDCPDETRTPDGFGGYGEHHSAVGGIRLVPRGEQRHLVRPVLYMAGWRLALSAPSPSRCGGINALGFVPPGIGHYWFDPQAFTGASPRCARWVLRLAASDASLFSPVCWADQGISVLEISSGYGGSTSAAVLDQFGPR